MAFFVKLLEVIKAILMEDVCTVEQDCLLVGNKVVVADGALRVMP